MTPTLEEAEGKLSCAVYDAAVKFFEELEHKGCIVGNGHHAAQSVTRAALETLRQRWIHNQNT